MAVEEREIRVTNELLAWIGTLDERTRALVVDAIDRAVRGRAGTRTALVDSITHSSVRNLKELRPGSAGRTELRIIFAFDPWRSAILLTGGDKSGDWQGWYRRAIPHAEELYAQYLKEREAEEGR
ncbi:MAG TPA: type II toxin-antitoxin system RelE/ParE family toxin [Trebonia sp.]|nr:type II toxin-antitoxin system RelE/ParE family toxin [Trebonia sp.]